MSIPGINTKAIHAVVSSGQRLAVRIKGGGCGLYDRAQATMTEHQRFVLIVVIVAWGSVHVHSRNEHKGNIGQCTRVTPRYLRKTFVRRAAGGNVVAGAIVTRQQ
jgi:hypothetical protein